MEQLVRLITGTKDALIFLGVVALLVLVSIPIAILIFVETASGEPRPEEEMRGWRRFELSRKRSEEELDRTFIS